jgi:hypothetical protein
MTGRQALIGALALVVAMPGAPAIAQAGAVMSPAQAIAAATAAPGGKVDATIEMDVASTGASGFAVFLNSAKDYRDPANLTVELHSAAKAALRGKLGGEAEDLLGGKHIRVAGTVRRVAIPRKDGSSYLQTRVDVDRVEQITISG